MLPRDSSSIADKTDFSDFDVLNWRCAKYPTIWLATYWNRYDMLPFFSCFWLQYKLFKFALIDKLFPEFIKIRNWIEYFARNNKGITIYAASLAECFPHSILLIQPLSYHCPLIHLLVRKTGGSHRLCSEKRHFLIVQDALIRPLETLE